MAQVRSKWRHSSPAGLRAAVALVIVGALASVLAAPVAAAPVLSTTGLTLSPPVDDETALMLRATVYAAQEATGVVVFTIDGVEVGRALLESGVAVITVPPVSSAYHDFVASYLGSPEVEASSAASRRYISNRYPVTSVTGTFHIGSVALPVEPRSLLFTRSSAAVYDPLSGVVADQTGRFVPTKLTEEVDGYGTVDLWVEPVAPATFQGRVLADGRFTAPLTPLSISVTRITVGGVTWGTGVAGCVTPAVAVSLVGTADTESLTVQGTSATPLAPVTQACGGFADLVDAVLDEPLSVALEVPGAFPAPPPPGTQTTLTIEDLPETATVEDRVRARVVLGAGAWTPTGSVTVVVDGGAPRSVPIVGGVAPVIVDVHEAGPLTVDVQYPGSGNLSSASGSATVDVGPAPVGLPASGTIRLNPTSVADFGAGTTVVGASFDPADGSIGPTTLWAPEGVVPVDTGLVGFVDVRVRLIQEAPVSGAVAPDGTVTLEPATFRLEARSWNLGSGWAQFADCTFGPFPVELVGRADATGLHLADRSIAVPPVASTACSGYGSFINPRLSAISITLDVAGDFGRTPSAVTAATWFPDVAQHNQTYLVAKVDGSAGVAPTGTVTFLDGATVLGEAAVDASGVARLVAAMPEPGVRRVIARYGGDADNGAGEAPVTVNVSPAPDGAELDGNVRFGDVEVPIVAGAQIVPATPPGGGAAPSLGEALASSRAAMWFVPTTIDLDVGGYGPVRAEVRLVQAGELSAASGRPDGTIDGLSGSFVLQVRKVTSAAGTVVPLGCVNLVRMDFDGRFDFVDLWLASATASSVRIPFAACTGLGNAVATRLAGADVVALLHASA